MCANVCQRCTRANESSARYCGTCGCPLRVASRTGSAQPIGRKRRTGTVGWIVVALLLIASIPHRAPTMHGLVFAGRDHRRVGLVYDLPVEYGASVDFDGAN